jgi:hypothetical protein
MSGCWEPHWDEREPRGGAVPWGVDGSIVREATNNLRRNLGQGVIAGLARWMAAINPLSNWIGQTTERAGLGTTDVFYYRCPCSGRIAGAQGFNDLDVLAKFVARGNCAAHLVGCFLNELSQSMIARRTRHGQMKLAIVVEELSQRRAAGADGRRLQGGKVVDFSRRNPCRGKLGGGAFERHAYLEQVVHIIDRDWRNQIAFARQRFDQTVTLKYCQGLSNRSLAYTKAMSQCGLDKKFARRERERDNVPAKLRVNALFFGAEGRRLPRSPRACFPICFFGHWMVSTLPSSVCQRTPPHIH